MGEPAQFEPGEERVHTNANTNLLGAVVEKVTGQEFGDALEERILQPLRQTGTRYIIDATDWTDHPLGYALLDGEQTVQNDNLSICGAAGSYDLYALGVGETNGWWGHNGERLGFTAAVFHQPESGASIVGTES